MHARAKVSAALQGVSGFSVLLKDTAGDSKPATFLLVDPLYLLS